jgi:glycosyltransferase involved in cell wall biosynthesis
MRILVLHRALPSAGGAEIYAHEVARHWVRAGHDVTLVCARVPEQPAEEMAGGVHVLRMGNRFGVHRAARRWYRTHGRGRFDVVVDEGFGAPRWVTDTHVIGLIHQGPRHYPLEPLWLRSFRHVPVLTLSASNAESLAGHGLHDVTAIPPGLTRRPRPGVARAQRPTLISVGRPDPAHILAALQLVRQRVPDTELWFVGDRPLWDRHAPAGVRFFGRVTSAVRDELIARAHIHVITSLREGWGLVVDEAAAMGTPTIGYDRPGLSDSIPAARGLLVEPHPKALAAAVAQRLPALVRNPALSGWRGGALDWPEVASRLLATIQARVGLSSIGAR